jgi:flavin-dependent dehydrogenase
MAAGVSTTDHPTEAVSDVECDGASKTEYDAVVVGAGPAGTMTALELARHDLAVLIVERQPMPRWKVCGACLSPGTLELLAQSGLPAPLDGIPLLRLRLSAWSAQASLPLSGSMAVSRHSFDQMLLAAARNAGVVAITPARARLGPIDGGARIVRIERAAGDLEVSARIVIDAGGLGGGLARTEVGVGGLSGGLASTQAGANDVTPGSRIGVGAVFAPGAEGYASEEIHMVVGTGGYVGLVRVEDGSLTVAAALDPAWLREHASPGDAVGALLRTAGSATLPEHPEVGWKGTRALTRSPLTRGAERVFAVGDAAGYVEPFTGEGISWALAGARALASLAARATQRWDPSLLHEWDRAHSQSMARAQRLCRAVVWTSRRPRLVLAALHMLARLPGVASPFVRRAGSAPALHLPV